MRRLLYWHDARTALNEWNACHLDDGMIKDITLLLPHVLGRLDNDWQEYSRAKVYRLVANHPKACMERSAVSCDMHVGRRVSREDLEIPWWHSQAGGRLYSPVLPRAALVRCAELVAWRILGATVTRAGPADEMAEDEQMSRQIFKSLATRRVTAPTCSGRLPFFDKESRKRVAIIERSLRCHLERESLSAQSLQDRFLNSACMCVDQWVHCKRRIRVAEDVAESVTRRIRSLINGLTC